MKITCDCGNKSEFVENNDEELFDEEWGIYVDVEGRKFSFGEEHDRVGIKCNGCGKEIWMFP